MNAKLTLTLLACGLILVGLSYGAKSPGESIRMDSDLPAVTEPAPDLGEIASEQEPIVEVAAACPCNGGACAPPVVTPKDKTATVAKRTPVRNLLEKHATRRPIMSRVRQAAPVRGAVKGVLSRVLHRCRRR